MEYFCLLGSLLLSEFLHFIHTALFHGSRTDAEQNPWVLFPKLQAAIHATTPKNSSSESKGTEQDPTMKHLKLIFEGHKQAALFPATMVSKSSKVKRKISESGDHTPCIENISAARAFFPFFLVCWLVRSTAP